MSSLISTSSFNSDLIPGLVAKWFGDYNLIAPIFPEFVQVEAMLNGVETDAAVSPMGAAVVKRQGSVLRLDSAAESYKTYYTSISYALGFAITKEALQDGHAFKDAKRFTEMLKRSMQTTKEILCANLLNNAASTVLGDGVVLASASHPTVSGLQSNILGSGADLSEAAIEALRLQIKKATDDRGNRINIAVRALVIPPDIEADAHRILNSSLRVASADNDANFLNDSGYIPRVVVNPYLTSTSQWQLVTDMPEGLKLKVRQDAQMDMDNDFMTKQGLYSADMRLSVGSSNWRGTFLSL